MDLAAMRLRLLGSTQSLVFFAFPETHQSILDVCKMSDKDKIGSSHVVHWLLEQTCRANEQLQNLYIAQGTDYCHRLNAEWEKTGFLYKKSDTDAYLKVLQHPEQQTLEQLYGRGMEDAQPISLLKSSFAELQVFIDELSKQRRAASGSENAFHNSMLEEVEQEREVEFQVEEVREVQKPTHHKPFVFPGLHSAIPAFVETGILTGESGYEHVFTALARTSVGQKFNVCCTASRAFVSTEFMRTAKFKCNGSIDNFLVSQFPPSLASHHDTDYHIQQRPVEWLLWNPSNETALVVISEEAELLIPIIRADPSSKVHLITYSAPITKKMLHFSGLTYYALPRLPDNYVAPHWLSIELGIFAGRLYMDFVECAPLTAYLQLAGKTDERKAPKANGDQPTSPFVSNPISFLLEWLALRRKGQDIMHTPVGYICHGRPLHKSHPFFAVRSTDAEQAVGPSIVGIRGGGDIDGAGEEHMDSEDEWYAMDHPE